MSTTMSPQLIIQLQLQMTKGLAAIYCAAGVQRWDLWRSLEEITCSDPVPVVMPTAGIACKSLFITWLCFAWGNILACAKMIAKMRRQGQRPILLYVLLLAVGPWGMQKFCIYFLQINFLWGCLSLSWWEKGWELHAVQLEEHCRKLLMGIIGLWR